MFRYSNPMRSLMLIFLLSSAGFADIFSNRALIEISRHERQLAYKRSVSVTDEERAELAKLDPAVSTLIVFDGLSSGADYAPTARALFPGIQIIHVQNGHTLPPGLAESFKSRDYDANVVFTGKNSDPLTEILRPFKQGRLVMVAGTETGVEAFDHFASRLGLISRRNFLGSALNNKFQMAEVAKPFLEKVGIETIPGLATSEAKMAIEWIRERAIQFPVFVKPVASAGSFGGGICHSDQEIRNAFKKLIGVTDPMGNPVSELLIQPAITGEGLREVVPNGVFDHEVGFVPTDFFEYKKDRNGNEPVYFHSTLRRWDLQNPLHAKLIQGVRALGEAFEIQNAALHPEFFVLGDRIIFVEVGRRAAGGGMPQFVRACGGNDQIKMHLLSLLDREAFLALVKAGPQLRTEGVMMDLVYAGSLGRIRSVPSDLDLSARIPGFHSASLSHMKVDAWINTTSTVFDSPGVVSVQGDEATREKAELVLRNWEANGFYDVSEAGACTRALFRLRNLVKRMF